MSPQGISAQAACPKLQRFCEVDVKDRKFADSLSGVLVRLSAGGPPRIWGRSIDGMFGRVDTDCGST
jgi:hypothetical protein